MFEFSCGNLDNPFLSTFQFGRAREEQHSWYCKNHDISLKSKFVSTVKSRKLIKAPPWVFLKLYFVLADKNDFMYNLFLALNVWAIIQWKDNSHPKMPSFHLGAADKSPRVLIVWFIFDTQELNKSAFLTYGPCWTID